MTGSRNGGLAAGRPRCPAAASEARRGARRVATGLAVAAALALTGGAAATAPEPPSGDPLAEARGRLAGGDAAGALQLLEPLAAGGDLEDATRSLLGAAYLAAGRPADALDAVRPLVEGGRADAPTLFAAARAARALGRAEEARRWLRSSVELEPVSPAALMLAEMLAEQGDTAGARRVVTPLVSGAAAAELARAAPPLAIAAHRLAVRAGLAEGHAAETVGSLRALTELVPGDPAGWRQLGEVLLELERIDEAYAALARAQEIEEAIRDGRRDVAAAGGSAAVPELIARAHRAQQDGRGEEALALLREAMRAAPSDPRPRILEIRLLIGLRRPAEALPRAETLVGIAPRHSEGYYLRGMARLALQELDAAETDLRQALTLEPRHLAALNGLAILLISRREYSQAEGVLLDLLAAWPDDEMAQRNLDRVRRLLAAPR